MDPRAPALAAANIVFVKYCTSDAWFGDAPAPFPGLAFAYRGRPVLDALWSALARDEGLGAAPRSRVVFGGCSAGARGALFNLKRAEATLRGLLKAPANLAFFGGLIDSAFWIDLAPLDARATPFAQQAREAFAAFNATAPGVVAPACAAAFGGAEAWKCIFGEYALAFVDQPFFLHSYQYDAFQLAGDEGVKTPTTAPQLAYAETFRNRTRAAFARDVAARAPPAAAALLPACYHHCNTMGDTFSTAHTNGVTLEDAVAAWLDAGSTAYNVEECRGFACGTECPK